MRSEAWKPSGDSRCRRDWLGAPRPGDRHLLSPSAPACLLVGIPPADADAGRPGAEADVLGLPFIAWTISSESWIAFRRSSSRLDSASSIRCLSDWFSLWPWARVAEGTGERGNGGPGT